MASVKKSLTEKRWALVAIGLGVLLGFGSAIICIAWNLVIFGFNIMYIVSPLLAGFVETMIATKKYGRSTGAISALLTFLLINGYGWLGPGWIFPKEPATLSLITIIALVLTIQAAFPILVNYILFVVVMGTFSRIISFLMGVPAGISQKIIETQPIGEITPSADEIFLQQLTIPLITVHQVNGGKISKYLGLVVGQAVAKEKTPEGRFSSLVKMIEPVKLEEMNLGDARKEALSRMLDEAEAMGANAVEEVLIDYVSMGGLQGSATIVTATGTALLLQKGSISEEYLNSGDREFKEGQDIIRTAKKKENEDFKIKKEVSSNGGIVLDSDEEIMVNKSDVSKRELSYRIDQYMRERDNPPVKNLESAIDNEFSDFEKAYAKISKDIEKIDQESQKFGVYTEQKINEKYTNANLKSGFEGWGIKKIKKDIVGKEVVDVNGQVIGKVKDVDVSLQSRLIEALILGKEGILENLGSSRNEVVIPYKRILAMKDRIILKD